MPRDQHPGDGVYLSTDGYQLWLDHRNRVIALNPGVFLNLVSEGTKILNDQTHSDFQAEVVAAAQKG